VGLIISIGFLVWLQGWTRQRSGCGSSRPFSGGWSLLNRHPRHSL